ncbi:MAG: hypothetical protein JWN00_2530 [Actinomycetia bacterium]|nr:hypothetical protein [Actinomycetes bacterium]
MVGGIVAGLVLIAATLFGLVRRRRDGVLRPVAGASVPLPGSTARTGESTSAVVLDLRSIGAQTGSRATLVQFSTAFCAPCRATKRILSEVAGMVDGVVHVEIDAEAHLELVRRFNIMRTPTVLVLDGAGRVVQKAVGQPRKADIIAALGQAIPS